MVIIGLVALPIGTTIVIMQPQFKMGVCFTVWGSVFMLAGNLIMLVLGFG